MGSPEPEPRKGIVIDLHRILDIAVTGARRSYGFMALGVNAATDPEFKKLDLTEVVQVRLLPEDLSDEQVSNLKGNFGIWITGCGLRELIESFSVFLDAVHKALLVVGVRSGEIDPKSVRKKHKTFSNSGLSEKLKVLDSEFGFDISNSHFLVSVNKARACITHRRGIVGARDCDDDSCLSVRWIGPKFLVIGDSGKQTPLKERHFVEEDSTITVEFVEKELKFDAGQFVDIPAEILAEICFFVDWEARKAVKELEKYLKSRGIPTVEDPATN